MNSKNQEYISPKCVVQPQHGEIQPTLCMAQLCKLYENSSKVKLELPVSSSGSHTISLNRLEEAGSPASKTWEKCEVCG